MPELHDTDALSIGEVLGLLLEEFPDVTISKIRFLESQGLIAPERTASGYRKFYEADIELLRVILREQRQNYLPLRVIKDRLDSGQIDPTGEVDRPELPEGATSVNGNGHDRDHDPHDAHDPHDQLPNGHGTAHGDDPTDGHGADGEVPDASVASHPAGRRPVVARRSVRDRTSSVVDLDQARPVGGDPSAGPTHDHTPVVPQMLPGVVLDRGELLAMTGIEERELAQLEEYGVVAARGTGADALYDEDAVTIAKIAAKFLRLGVDARHLRSFRTSADREVGLYEQLVTPRLRHRNPESRAQAVRQVQELDDLGGRLRSAMTRSALRRVVEG